MECYFHKLILSSKEISKIDKKQAFWSDLWKQGRIKKKVAKNFKFKLKQTKKLFFLTFFKILISIHFDFTIVFLHLPTI